MIELLEQRQAKAGIRGRSGAIATASGLGWAAIAVFAGATSAVKTSRFACKSCCADNWATNSARSAILNSPSATY
ncbi:MAG: hypothetical protein HC886_08505 [Leptolyngbyaceae cyanobacterium SM1_1_3]|nr:hypothetical protein [Leptolyngbyaceae cyanobacterium SM1_1_3]